MITFIIGLFCGSIAGVIVMSMCSIASDSDRRMEEIIHNEEDLDESIKA